MTCSYAHNAQFSVVWPNAFTYATALQLMFTKADVIAGTTNTTSVDAPRDPQLVNADWGVCECNQTMQVSSYIATLDVTDISHAITPRSVF